MSTQYAQIEQEELWRILDVTRQLGAPIELSEILRYVIDAARAVLHADRGTVFLCDDQADELYTTVATGEVDIRFPADKGIVGACFQSRKVVNVPDAYADERFNRQVDRDTGYRTRCILSVPLIGFDDSRVGVLQVINKIDGVFDERDERIATALAAQCAVALQRARLIDEFVHKQKMERDLAVARDIQMCALPVELPSVAGYDLAAWNRPADETGGDVYDAVALDEQRIMMVLGDATGHGVGPALCATQMRAMFRMAVRLDTDLDTALIHINAQLTDDLPGDRFVTVFLGILDADRHEVAYHAGGQGPLLHYHAADDECQWLDASTLPLGIVDEMNAEAPPAVKMAPGDLFAVISDGVYECRDPAGQMYAKERVGDLIRQHHAGQMSDLIDAMLSSVRSFVGSTHQDDDMTIVVLRRLP